MQGDLASDDRSEAEQCGEVETFEPSTTPAPIVFCWWASAVMEAVISGASAASSATMPRMASENPKRSPTALTVRPAPNSSPSSRPPQTRRQR